MPTPTVDLSFVSQFEREVHVEYQRMGAKLISTVRRRTGIVGKDTTFQIYGSGEAGTKARGGKVPILNVPHSVAKLTLEDYYAGEYVERFDELKLIHPERQLAAQAVANAVGRKSDALLIDEYETAVTTNVVPESGTALLQTKVETVWTYFEDNYVPDDGQRFGIVSPEGWIDLLAITDFSNRDYVPESEMPYAGAFQTMKRWHSFFWMTHSALPKTGDTRSCMCYHRSALAFGSGSETVVTPSWENDLQSWLVVAKLSQGAKLIDETGCYKILIDEAV